MADMRLGIVVDTDTRATKAEFSALRRDVKREADALGGDWEAAAEKVETALRDAGARDDLIDAAKRIGEQGPTEIEKMRTALRDLDGGLDDTTRAANDAAENIREGFEENSITPEDLLGAEVMGEVLSNAAESGAEVARGFKDGFGSEDVETILDGVTDTIVSVGAVGGPLGIAAGLAGATAIQAFAGPFLEDAEKTAEQFAATFDSAFENISAAGEEAGKELTISGNITELVQDVDRLNAATETANALGIDRGQVIRALAGDVDALAAVEAAGAEKVEDAADAYDKAAKAADGSLEATNALEEANANSLNTQAAVEDALRDVTKEHNTNVDAVDAATDAVKARSEADAIGANKAIENAKATARQTGEAQELEVTIDGVTRAIKVLPNGKTVKVTDEGSAKDTQKKISGIKGKDVEVDVKANTYAAEQEIIRLTSGRRVVNIDVRYRRAGGPTP